MKTGWTLRGAALIAALLLALAGCGGGGGSGDGVPRDDSDAAAASFDFTLTSYARTGSGDGASTQSVAAPAAGQVEVSGQLLVERLESDGNEETIFNYSLLIDEGAFAIDTAVVLDLEPGTYHFYFVLAGGGRYYAGVVQNHLVLRGGTNSIGFVLNPVISDGAVDAKTIQALAQFQFQYNAAEINTYADPAFSITVDNGPENIFSINPITGLPFVYVLLPPGTYHFVLRFYDGSTLKLVAEADVDIGADGGSTQIDVVPIRTEVTYTYTPTGSPETDVGDVVFTIPAAIVNEVGGLTNLRADVALVGAATPLTEQTLTLAASDTGTNYHATVEVPGFQPGELTWSIQFRDLGSGGRLFAYCAQTVVVPDTGTTTSETFICEPALITTAVVAQDPPATLTVDVTDGEPVPGAVVHKNEEPIGITASGSVDGVAGQLESFLPADLYLISALHQTVDPATGEVLTRSAEQPVSLTPGGAESLTLTLGALPEPPLELSAEPEPSAVDALTLTASRESRPTRFNDGSVELPEPARIRIPDHEALELLQGDANRFLLILYFDAGVKCWFLGGQWDAAVGGTWEQFFHETFKSPACNKGYRAGDVIEQAGPIQARVVMGNPHFDVTELRATIEVVAWGDSTTGN